LAAKARFSGLPAGAAAVALLRMAFLRRNLIAN